ncbi:transposase [Vibrio parahaemolyticus]|nr:transposase [Vibrio parahaemolyticus]
MKKLRRYYEDDYKRAIVCLVVKQGYAIAQVSRIFELGESGVRRWVKETPDKQVIPRISLEQSQQQLETIEELREQVTNLKYENADLQKAVGKLYLKINKISD